MNGAQALIDALVDGAWPLGRPTVMPGSPNVPRRGRLFGASGDVEQ